MAFKHKKGRLRFCNLNNYLALFSIINNCDVESWFAKVEFSRVPVLSKVLAVALCSVVVIIVITKESTAIVSEYAITLNLKVRKIRCLCSNLIFIVCDDADHFVWKGSDYDFYPSLYESIVICIYKFTNAITYFVPL